MSKKYRFIIVVVLVYLTKLVIDLFGVVSFAPGSMTLDKLSFNKKYAPLFNADEYEMSRTAKYYLQGKGFLTDVSFDKPDFRKEKVSLSGLRPKYQVYAHLLGIRLYELVNPEYSIASSGDLPESYYEAFSFVILLIKNIFLIISVFYFYRLCRLYFSAGLSQITTLIYLVYPSLFFYVGMFNIYDCLVTYILVIVISMILSNYTQNKAFTTLQAVLTGILLIICLLKSQSILIIGLLYMGLFVLYFRNISYSLIRFYLLSGGILMVGIFPVLYQNYKDYHAFFLTTQSGVTFFLGHNPLARGSWYPGLWSANNGEIMQLLEPYKDRLSQGELAESKVYKELAMHWIISNPLDEFVLILRKSAILFLPHNFMSWKINIFTLLVHIGFFGFCLVLVKSIKRVEKSVFLLLVPIIAVYCMSILYYVEYRWRLFADPFLIICAVYFYREMYFHLFSKGINRQVE
jgi:hypothetical protein